MPQETGVFIARADGALLALEAQEPQRKGSLGVLGMKAALVFEGARSPVRFRAGQALSFIVRINPEPAATASPILWRAHVARASRRVELGYSTSLAADMTGSPDIVPAGRTALDRRGLVEIRPGAPLAPGEYFLGMRAQGGDAVYGQGYGFGID